MRPTITTLVVSAASLILTACALLPASALAQSNGEPASAEAAASPIGKVVTAKGSVTIQHVNAVVVQASLGGGATKVGDFVYKGDVVSTGADGAVGITFSDGTAFNLSSNARMELNEFVYNPKGKENSTFFKLSKGTFTFIAGKVAKTGDMKIDTPVATMGIRGTAPRVEISADGAVSFSTLVEDGNTKTKDGLKQLHSKGQPAAGQAGAGEDNPFKVVLKAMGLCNGLDRQGGPDSQINGCTALIDSDQKTAQTLAHAYNNRGNAYSVKGDYDLAIKDYVEAIKATPTTSRPSTTAGSPITEKASMTSQSPTSMPQSSLMPPTRTLLSPAPESMRRKASMTAPWAIMMRRSGLCPHGVVRGMGAAGSGPYSASCRRLCRIATRQFA